MAVLYRAGASYVLCHTCDMYCLLGSVLTDLSELSTLQVAVLYLSDYGYS